MTEETAGEKRKTELLKTYKSIAAIKAASLEELSRVVPKNAARAVYEHFHKEDSACESSAGAPEDGA